MFSEITKRQYLQKKLSYFVYLLHVVTHPRKLLCCYAVMVGYDPACPKLFEITYRQYLRKVLRDFMVIYMLLDIQ